MQTIDVLKLTASIFGFRMEVIDGAENQFLLIDDKDVILGCDGEPWELPDILGLLTELAAHPEAKDMVVLPV